MEKKRIESALNTGTKASAVLWQVLDEVKELNCPEADGFEGPGTFPTCDTCIVCLAKKIMEEQDND